MKRKIYRTSFMNIINYSYLLYDTVSGECATVDPAWDISAIQADIKQLDLHLKLHSDDTFSLRPYE